MNRPWRARCKLGVAAALAGSLLSLTLLAQETVPARRGDANLERGKGLYVMHCQRCHGAEGDELECMDIVPLAGLARRPRVGLVGDVLSPSYFFRGTSFKGADARDLAAYLLSLKGEKGFDDPGLRCPIRLLDKRYELFEYYRAIDVRGRAAYAKGHIPNAERWPAGGAGSSRQALTTDIVRQNLGLLAVRPAMSIVIYDDTVTPAAARLWWDIVRAGQKNVAILDGGFREWASEGYSVTDVVTPLAPGTYAPSGLAAVAAVRAGRNYPVIQFRAGLARPASGVFDWKRTVAGGQLRTAAEIREYLKRSDIRFPGAYRAAGSDDEASFLVYVLRLLGYSGASYDPVSKVLTADNSGRQVLGSRRP
jgi:3-mercaptopyruvate sulfurtransferase SseA/mono/diheme cytochrome c family protein